MVCLPRSFDFLQSTVSNKYLFISHQGRRKRRQSPCIIQNRDGYGANHLETMTFVQTQNHLEVKIYTLLLYMGIKSCSIQYFKHQSSRIPIGLSAMRQFGDVLKETPSMVSLNLIPLGDLSSPSKGVFFKRK